MASVISFPSSRCRAVRIERERDGLGGWLVLADAYGDLHGDFATAMAEARNLASELNVTIRSSAGVAS